MNGATAKRGERQAREAGSSPVTSVSRAVAPPGRSWPLLSVLIDRGSFLEHHTGAVSPPKRGRVQAKIAASPRACQSQPGAERGAGVAINPAAGAQEGQRAPGPQRGGQRAADAACARSARPAPRATHAGPGVQRLCTAVPPQQQRQRRAAAPAAEAPWTATGRRSSRQRSRNVSGAARRSACACGSCMRRCMRHRSFKPALLSPPAGRRY